MAWHALAWGTEPARLAFYHTDWQHISLDQRITLSTPLGRSSVTFGCDHASGMAAVFALNVAQHSSSTTAKNEE